MGDVRVEVDDDADRRLRPRSPAGRRGHHDTRPVPVARVVLYTAAGCHLCEAAKRVVLAAQADEGFELDEVDISGDEALEAEYREWLPVVEIDGERAFTYFVQPDSLRRKLAQARSGDATL
ncbi:MAG TPA: glutaredoxin family protein [Gaiellaceae bacterium]